MRKVVNFKNICQFDGKSICRVVVFVTLLGVVLGVGATTRHVVEVNTGTAHRDLYDLELTGSGYGLAVGAMGTILSTEDGGETWTFHNYPTHRAFFAVAIANDTAVITGQDGIVIVRHGREGKWQKKSLGTQQRLLSVDMSRGGFGIIVGSFGTLFRTVDGGDTWTKVDAKLSEQIKGGYDPHLNRVQVLGDGVAVMVGEFGLVVRTSDRGESWKIIRQGDASLFGLDILSSGLGYAVGQTGTVLRTRDAGLTWNKLETGTSGNLLGVAVSVDGSTITVPGMRVMIVSDDGGKTWMEVSAGDVGTMWYMDAVATDHGVLAVGHSTKVIRILKTVP